MKQAKTLRYCAVYISYTCWCAIIMKNCIYIFWASDNAICWWLIWWDVSSNEKKKLKKIYSWAQLKKATGERGTFVSFSLGVSHSALKFLFKIQKPSFCNTKCFFTFAIKILWIRWTSKRETHFRILLFV